jgi:geranylgeranyl diphosphate synthase type I
MTSGFVLTEGRSAHELLAWGRETTEPVLRAAVSGLPESIGRIVGYHFGWWDRRGRPTGGTRGKALRPTLVLLSATALGGTTPAASDAAAAVELVHNFSLVHDDVLDGDLARHHRPTVWREFGTDRAIVAGDAMLALALQTILRDPPASTRGGEWLSRCVVQLCAGQDDDLGFERRADVTVPECLAMTAGKTASLLACSCALGALCADAHADRIDAMRLFGHELGMAFQLVDDLLGIWGDPQTTGKPVGADLFRRKKSLPVVAALASDTAAGRELADLYRRDEPLDADAVARAAVLVERAGGRAWAHEQADARLTDAITYLDGAHCDPGARADLITLARLIAHRDH